MASKLASVYITDSERDFLDCVHVRFDIFWGTGTVRNLLKTFFDKISKNPGHVNYIMFHYDDRSIEDHWYFNDDIGYDFITTELKGKRVTMLAVTSMKYISRNDTRNLYRIVVTNI